MQTVTIDGIQVTKEQLKAALAKFDKPEYPRCFRSHASGGIVLFTALTEGAVLKAWSDVELGDKANDWKPHTDTNIWEEIPYDRKHGFYEKQLVYCWDGSTHNALVCFWNVKSSRPYSSSGTDGGVWKNYSATLPEHMKQFKE